MSILQGLEMGLREWTWCVQGHKNKLTLSKRHFFVIEKYVEGVKHDENRAPDLLEPITRSILFVKEETTDFVQNESIWIQNFKFKVSTFWIPEV